MRHLFTGITLAAMVAASTAVPAMTAQGAVAPTPTRASLLKAQQVTADQTRSALGLSAGEKLVVKDVITDKDGATHVRYERTFQGLRVLGGDFVAHRDKAGSVKTVSRNGSGKVDVASTTPKLSVTTADAAASKARPATVPATTAPQGELVIYAGGAAPVRAYDVLTEGFQADQTPSKLHTVVDATTGRTLTSWDAVEKGSGSGLFVGTVDLGTAEAAGGYQMKDPQGNTTTDLNNKTSGAGSIFSDADDVWGDGTNSDRASAAVDALYAPRRPSTSTTPSSVVPGSTVTAPGCPRGSTTATATSTRSGTGRR